MAQTFPPGLAGWVAADQLAAQRQSQKLGALQGLMQIENQRMQQAEFQRARQEEEQLKGVLAQSGGNPDAAIKALVTAGTPKSLALAAQLRTSFAKPTGQAIGAGGLLTAEGTVIQPAARPEQPRPFSNVHNVPGGYIEEYEPGKRRFVRTQREPNEPAPVVTEIMRDGKTIKIDARTGKEIGESPTATNRPLPTSLMNDLVESGKTVDASERFIKTFKDEYGGFVSDVAGRAMLAGEKRLSGNTGRVGWWQDYEMHQNIIRNKLFGSALTANEQAIWERSTITPGMDARQIKNNLKTRETIERTGFTRLSRAAAAQFNPRAVEEAIGRPIPALPKQLPPVNDKGWKLMEDANGRKAYVGPNNEIEAVQ